MIVNESSNTKKIKDATAISEEIGYNEIAYINNNEKIIGEMPIGYNNTQQITMFTTLPRTENWTHFYYEGGKYILISQNYILSSDDGVTWNETSINMNHKVINMAYGNNIYVILFFNGETMVSANGKDWSYQSIYIADDDDLDYNEDNEPCGEVGYLKICYDDKNNNFIVSAVGSFYFQNFPTGTYNQMFIRSKDGCNWYGEEWCPTFGIDLRFDGSKILTTDGENLFTTEDGGNFFVSITEEDNMYYYLFNSIGKLCITGGAKYQNPLNYYPNSIIDYEIIYSIDNYQTWNKLEQFNGKEVSKINYLNNTFIILFANDNFYAYSKDLINWNTGYTPNSNLSDICYDGEKYLSISKNSNIINYSKDLNNWSTTIEQNNYKLENIESGMLVTIPEQTVERRIIKEEYNNTPYIKFEDETLIFPSFEEVEENTLSNHPEGSYYVVYEDLIAFGIFCIAIADYEYYFIKPNTTWEEFFDNSSFWVQYDDNGAITTDGYGSGNYINLNTRAIKPTWYSLVDENNNICYKNDIITAQNYFLL